MASSSRLPKHNWTKEEEAGLVECLVELVNAGGWRSNNETFWPRYLNQLARMMAFKIPEKEVFENWVKSHPAAKRLLNKSFPHYNELSYVFGKDHATGGRTKSFADVRSNDSTRYEAFSADAVPDTDCQPMYQGLNMWPNELMGTKNARVREGRYVSSGSKRKSGGQVADNASQTRQEVVRQLEAIPELTLMDRCRLMRILMCNVDDMKAFLEVLDNMKYPYCSIILQYNR
ncbi:retrotransposon protein [Cucumis melo var. makuwa]|uniref:Retrotransposon protein n=1 Tax=Cucumis melo var. makuwa TaxID=1194695 RepID=A0A5D3DMM7_CUCMM|nr:retrotransposon protein [Cucumis melo var. makuwa]TYK24772.1 retrotransposon protein [Cucumis melo var. makuwa]